MFDHYTSYYPLCMMHAMADFTQNASTKNSLHSNAALNQLLSVDQAAILDLVQSLKYVKSYDIDLP